MPDDNPDSSLLAGETQRLFKSGGRISVDRWLKIVALACGYCFTGGLGLLLAVPPGYATAVWPPSGIALAGLLWWGPRAWPGIWVGSFLVNVWVAYATTNANPSFTSLSIAASIAVGSTLQALLGAMLVQRWVGAGRLFASAPAILNFTGIVAFCCLLAPTWGVASLALTGVVQPGEYLESWRTWWLGDLMGALVITPVLLTWRQLFRLDLRPWQLAEAIGSLLLVAALTALAFVGPSPQGGGAYPLSFLPLPCLVWIACRYKPGGVALATFVVSIIAVIATCNGMGPFARAATNESLLLLQAFTGLTTIMTLALAAAVAGQKQSEMSLRRLSSELEQLALTDELTGLRNRRGFLLLAEQGWRMARRTHAKCLLVFFDLDGLKDVNDTQGHPAGDGLIVDAAKVLTSVFRESDIVGRVGGDEFAVLSLLDKSDSAAAIDKRLQKQLDEFNEQAGRSFHLSMSFGIEELSGASDVSLEDLLSRADRAMDGQKRQNMRQRKRRQAT